MRKLKLLKFGATWCGPCKAVEPAINQLEAELGNLEVHRIDIDENLELAEQNNIASIPTFILIDVETEQVLDRKTGVASKTMLLDWITKHSS